VFKAGAVGTFGPGDGLLRFFALYYGFTGAVSFLLQIAASRRMLERIGIAGTTSTPSIALASGVLAASVIPGFGPLAVARAGEAIFRSSWFRAGYELFFTPIPAAEKRATKSLIDVACDRLGDAAAGAIIPVILLAAPGLQSLLLLSLALALSLGAIVAASHLNRWYVHALETSLLDRGGSLDLEDAAPDDMATAVIVGGGTVVGAGFSRPTHASVGAGLPVRRSAAREVGSRPADALAESIATLRSSDHRRIIRLLSQEEGLAGPLVAHVIPLLAVDALADYALFALRKVAEERVGQLTDALLDRNQALPVRRRLARVFSVGVSQRAADGLLTALDDERFDVRFQVARSLLAIRSRNPRVVIDPERIYQRVLAEVAVGRPVWEGRRLLDGFVSASPLDEFVRDRAGQSLAHVFTLLSLVLPREPLQIAFRSLQGEDRHLRGTALEYLEGVLPASVKEPLWPFLVHSRTPHVADQEQRVVELLRSSRSATLQGVAARWDRRSIADSGNA
jgi:hypothetical protein